MEFQPKKPEGVQGSEGEPKKVESPEEVAARVEALGDKYLVQQQEGGLEKEPLKDLSGEIEKLSTKERTKQVLTGMRRIGRGVIAAGLIPSVAYLGTDSVMLTILTAGLLAHFTALGAKESYQGIKTAFNAVKGEKYSSPDSTVERGFANFG